MSSTPPVPESAAAGYFVLGCQYPFRLEPFEGFDPLSDSDMTGGDDVWYARPTIIFLVQPAPTRQIEVKGSQREVLLVFFRTFEPISLLRDSYMQKNGIPMGAKILKRRRLAAAARQQE